MTRVLVAACAAALLSGGAVACARTAGPSHQASARGERTPTGQTRADARDLILNADVELQDLGNMRTRTDDPAARETIDRQIASVRKWRDAVQADAMARPGSPNRARLPADEANLERAMSAGAAAMPQPPSPAPLERRDTNPGAGGESMPPSR